MEPALEVGTGRFMPAMRKLHQAREMFGFEHHESIVGGWREAVKNGAIMRCEYGEPRMASRVLVNCSAELQLGVMN
jgi:hypothetical protein